MVPPSPLAVLLSDGAARDIGGADVVDATPSWRTANPSHTGIALLGDGHRALIAYATLFVAFDPAVGHDHCAGIPDAAAAVVADIAAGDTRRATVDDAVASPRPTSSAILSLHRRYSQCRPDEGGCLSQLQVKAATVEVI